MKHVILGTAGHVDHGKTALVKALTGIDTDRLKEEKERGISIELGFAYLDLGADLRLGVVDVPGHERFVKTMLAGAGGIDLVLLVVAADEGVMPQTREHLAICQLLGVKKGLTALTKCDLVEEDWLLMVEEELKKVFAGTFLEGAPVIPVSAVTGQGLEELKRQLKSMTEGIVPRSSEGTFRLPVDRAFTMKGFGTVVTGTMVSGKIKLGDTVEIWPGGLSARVRRLQVHGQEVTEAYAGSRTALNLAGIEPSQVSRGSVLATPGNLKISRRWDVHLELLKAAPAPLKHGARVRLHLGTAEVLARVLLLEGKELAPGREALAQLRLEEPLAALAYDRLVLRSYSPSTTIGGGVILDPHPPVSRRKRPEIVSRLRALEGGGPLPLLEKALLEAGPKGLSPKELTMAANLSLEALGPLLKILEEQEKVQELTLGPAGDQIKYLWRVHYRGLQERILKELERHHAQKPLSSWYPSREELRTRVNKTLEAFLYGQVLAQLEREGALEIQGDRLRLSRHRPQLSASQAALKDKLKKIYQDSQLAPPTWAELKDRLNFGLQQEHEVKSLLHLLVEEGVLVKIKSDLFLHHEAYGQMREKVAEYFSKNAEMGVSHFKDLLGLTRKFAVPYLEHLDEIGVTQRRGDVRVKGRQDDRATGRKATSNS